MACLAVPRPIWLGAASSSKVVDHFVVIFHFWFWPHVSIALKWIWQEQCFSLALKQLAFAPTNSPTRETEHLLDAIFRIPPAIGKNTRVVFWSLLDFSVDIVASFDLSKSWKHYMLSTHQLLQWVGRPRLSDYAPVLMEAHCCWVPQPNVLDKSSYLAEKHIFSKTNANACTSWILKRQCNVLFC